MPEAGSGRLPTWRVATERALYGDGGFYRRTGDGPGDHFRTSVHASPLFALAVHTLARSAGLGTVVDVGAGGGELLADLHGLDPSLQLVGVDLAGRPHSLPGGVRWQAEVPRDVEGLLVANEWLDNVPVDVVELTPSGWRLVVVDPADGREELGPVPSTDDLAWLDRWWPRPASGGRAEIGRPRDEAWAGVVGSLSRGVAVAVDYAHRADDRPWSGSLTAYRRGRQVPPVPDGSCDITTHVALDACAAAGRSAGAGAGVLTTQRAALAALGVRRAGPDIGTATSDPAGYLAALAESGAAAELMAADGLGAFGWLVQTVGVPLPASLAGLGATSS